MGRGKRGRLRVDQPTITGQLGPSSGRIEPTIACDDCTFVERLQAGALVMRRGFFFDGPTGGRVRTHGSGLARYRC